MVLLSIADEQEWRLAMLFTLIDVSAEWRRKYLRKRRVGRSQAGYNLRVFPCRRPRRPAQPRKRPGSILLALLTGSVRKWLSGSMIPVPGRECRWTSARPAVAFRLVLIAFWLRWGTNWIAKKTKRPVFLFTVLAYSETKQNICFRTP